MHFMVFSLGQGTEWEIFSGVAKISNIFGALINTASKSHQRQKQT